MLDKKYYDLICVSSNELQEPSSLKLRPELRSLLGETIGVIFPEFAQSFPLTVQAMEKHWPKPNVGFRYFRNRWQADFLLEREDLNVFFDLTSVSEDLDGQYFDDSHSMLPAKWKDLYRWFWSFYITSESVRSLYWLNTPFSFSARLDLTDYGQQVGATKSQTRDFRKKIDSDNLKCWLLTDAGDALFLDERRNDHKVYHVRNNDLNDCVVLEDPEVVLDRYLAHYVSGGSPAEFDFRTN